MNTPATPKAYLVCSSKALNFTVDSEDKSSLLVISKTSCLIDAKTGTKLVFEIGEYVQGDYLVAPIYDFIQARFTPEAKEWLDTRGIQAHRI